jgi:hypothetical protein
VRLPDLRHNPDINLYFWALMLGDDLKKDQRKPQMIVSIDISETEDWESQLRVSRV